MSRWFDAMMLSFLADGIVGLVKTDSSFLDVPIFYREVLLDSGQLIGWQTCWVLVGLRAEFVGLAEFHWLANWLVCWVGWAGPCRLTGMSLTG